MKTPRTFPWWIKLRILFKECLLYALAMLLGKTWRLQIVDPLDFLGAAARKEQKIVFAVFHCCYLVPFFINRHKDFATLTADNEAGEVLSRMIRHMGFSPIRVPADDNPKAAGRAAIRMIDVLRSGKPGAIAVDGPLGPAEKVKPGIFAIARKSGAKIIPGAAAGHRAMLLQDRWDKFRIPLPFTRVIAVVGPEFVPTHHTNEQELEKDCLRLEKTLKELTDKAEMMANK